MGPLASEGNLQETLTWDTQSDWDSATTQTNTIAEGGIIWLEIGIDDWDSYATGSLPSYVNDASQGNDRVVNTRSRSGTQSVKSDITAGTVGNALYFIDVRAGQYQNTIEFTYQETVDSTMFAISLVSSSSDVLLYAGTNNPQFTVEDGTGGDILVTESEVTPNYDEWRRIEIDIDWANRQVTYTWTDLTGSSTTHTAGGRSLKAATTDDIDRIEYTLGGDTAVWGGDDTDTWNDDSSGRYEPSGLLTSATKSFSSARQPDILSSSYTLNGESITLDVIGSPGTASEETVSQSLDGSSSFNLTWSNDHSDFRVEPNLSTSSPGTTPLFDSVVLS